MVAEVPGVIVDIGLGAGVVTAILAACTALSRLKAVRWVWRHLFSDPIGGWIGRVVNGVTAPQFDAVKANAKQQHDEQNERLDGINERLDTVATTTADLTTAVQDHTQRFLALEQRSVTVTDTHITSTPPEAHP